MGRVSFSSWRCARGWLPEGYQGWSEASRRGGHLWFLLERLVPALEARMVLLDALAQVQTAGLVMPPYELYPDTTQAGTLGHAVRLPLGVHQLTGKRYPLFDEEGRPCVFTTLRKAVEFVLEQPRVSSQLVRARFRALGQHHLDHSDYPDHSLPAGEVDGYHTFFGLQTSVQSDRPSDWHDQQDRKIVRVGTFSAVIRWVDAQVSALDLLAELVPETEMKRVGSGYLGWCPFHNDRAPDEAGKPGTPSFYVVHDRGFGWSWRCFSTNCAHSVGPLRHSFRLFQELMDLSVKSAIVEATQRWPASGVSGATYQGTTDNTEKTDTADSTDSTNTTDTTAIERS